MESPLDPRQVYRDAVASRRGIDVDETTFVDAFKKRGSDPRYAPDLLVALACLAGDPVALAVFELDFLDEARRSVARLRLDATTVDEIVQRVREKLLVGTGDSAPRIESYSARGPLVAWLRAAVVHEALSMRRADVRRRYDGVSAIERMPLIDEPELGPVRAKYAVSFKSAFAEALADLTPRDRNVLRLVYVDGLTADQVGLAYGVHRVSVARWLQQIRSLLFTATKKRLAEQLRLSPSEFESVARLCLSQIDVTLDRVLVDLDDPAR